MRSIVHGYWVIFWRLVSRFLLPFSRFETIRTVRPEFDLNLQPVLSEGIDFRNPFDSSRNYLFSSSGSGGKRTVRVERRRRAEPPPEGRERAETPSRERQGEGTPPPSYGGGGGTPRPRPSGGPGIPFKGPQSILGLILVLIVVCVFVAMQLFGSEDSQQEVFEQPAFPADPTEPFEILPLDTPTRSAVPTPAVASTISSASSGDQTWLVMLYQDADDKILEQDIYVDLNEAERVGSSDRLTIVAQIDRFRAGYQGDGDWTSAKRYLVKKDDDLSRVRSQEVADLGEINMADSAELVDFAEWAIESYPADRHVLILSDHGMGWPGGWSDAAPAAPGDPRIPLASRLGDQIYLNELEASLGEIRARTGIEKFDLIGLDACLMGQIEVFSALEEHARYAVASQEVEPALGWAYTSFLRHLQQDPNQDPASLSDQIVQTYIDDDQRIVDEQARSELLRQGGMNGMFGLFGSVTPEMLARQMSQEGTLSAIDLSVMPELNEELNRFAYALQGSSQPQVARARAYAQSFTSIFGSKVPPSYIDLGSFASLLANESNDSEVLRQVDALLALLDRAVISEKHGSKRPGATGISIYFPNSDLYRTPEAGARSYTAIANRFSELSLWDDYLAFHYAGRLFGPQDASPVLPESGADIRGPGEGRIRLTPVTSSDDVAAAGNPVLLSTDISGENIGYIYLFTGFYDRSANSIFVADMDYLESSDTREVGGVFYPDWGEGDFTLEFEWEPIVFAIDDGQKRVTALFRPQSYGRSFEDAVYTVDGIYTFSDSGETRPAQLHFSNGTLRQVVGFTGDAETGAPREIIPQKGDQFTINERWLDLDSSGRVVQTAQQQGDTLTFGDQAFRWLELDAAAGAYVVGFIVEDLDGNTFETFTQVAVQ